MPATAFDPVIVVGSRPFTQQKLWPDKGFAFHTYGGEREETKTLVAVAAQRNQWSPKNELLYQQGRGSTYAPLREYCAQFRGRELPDPVIVYCGHPLLPDHRMHILCFAKVLNSNALLFRPVQPNWFMSDTDDRRNIYAMLTQPGTPFVMAPQVARERCGTLDRIGQDYGRDFKYWPHIIWRDEGDNLDYYRVDNTIDAHAIDKGLACMAAGLPPPDGDVAGGPEESSDDCDSDYEVDLTSDGEQGPSRVPEDSEENEESAESEESVESDESEEKEPVRRYGLRRRSRSASSDSSSAAGTAGPTKTIKKRGATRGTPGKAGTVYELQLTLRDHECRRRMTVWYVGHTSGTSRYDVDETSWMNHGALQRLVPATCNVVQVKRTLRKVPRACTPGEFERIIFHRRCRKMNDWEMYVRGSAWASTPFGVRHADVSHETVFRAEEDAVYSGARAGMPFGS